jgi:hypothetical protein
MTRAVQRRATTRSSDMKVLTILKELTGGELISIAVLIAVAVGVVYGILS